VLRRFAGSKVLLAFDYDGTLAPIVAEPGRAVMRASTRRLLRTLTRLYPCAVISGRAQPDALRRLRGVGVHRVVGNHGAEPRQASRRVIAQVDKWRPALAKRVAGLSGVWIENKGLSLAVHYRRSSDKARARAAILAAAAGLGGVRLVGGKQVVNIVPARAPHKGAALERERARRRCATAIYVGDDETDEDVFALRQPGRLLTIRVGPRRRSAAAYYIRSQKEIDALLRALCCLRIPPPS
jgi:trehalose 6-phosphate phosphatase